MSETLDTITEALQAVFIDCTIEKAVKYTSYRLSSVPRRITLLDEQNDLIPTTVTPEMLAEAIAEVIGAVPALVNQTKASTSAPFDHSTSWIIRLPHKTGPLPRSMLVFGVRIAVKLLPQRVNIIQCPRCFQWHNERACARTARCKLCGSTGHTSASHPKCNGTTHTCIARCIHCHGPYAADSLECLLRPQANRAPLTRV